MSDHSTRSLVISDTLTMVGRSVRHSVRSVETLLIAALLPVLLLLLIFVYLFGGAISTRAALVEYLAPGIVVLFNGYGASLTAMSVRDRPRPRTRDDRPLPVDGHRQLRRTDRARRGQRRLQRRLDAAGVRGRAGRRLRPTAGPPEWLAVAGVLLLFVVAISWLSAAAGVLARTVEGANGVSFW